MVDTPAPVVMPWAVRVGTGLGLLVAGGTHLWLWLHAYRNTSVAPAFLADAGVSAVIGLLVLIRASRSVAWAGSLVAAAALLAYGMARTVGLFGFVERQWTFASLLAAGSEAAVLVLLLTEALLPPQAPPGRSP
jgi:hypothetical protein